MFQDRDEHQVFVTLSTILCVAGMTSITVSIFFMYARHVTGMGPTIGSMAGASLLFGGLGVNGFIRRHMS